MKISEAIAIAGIILLSGVPDALSCATVDENLHLAIPCIDVNGIFYQVDFNKFDDPANPLAIYWSLDAFNRTTDNGSCASADGNLDISIPCAEYSDEIYSATLKFHQNLGDPIESYWLLDQAQPIHTYDPISGEQPQPEANLSPDDILAQARIDLLEDKVYFFPGISNDNTEPQYLALSKWDMIFTSGSLETGYTLNSQSDLISRIIPGVYTHILVYLGKDQSDRAYAAELNVISLKQKLFEVVAEGGLRLYCLGKDYGEEQHPSGKHIFQDEFYSTRWAKNVTPEIKEQLKKYDTELTENLQADLIAEFPYQLEFDGNLLLLSQGQVRLIDDGREGGAGCADYWTSLFEDVAQVCLTGVRMDPAEIMVYYLTDPVGQSAYIPGYLNVIGDDDILISDLLQLGFSVVADQPHQFTCDGSREQGLVLPDLIFHSSYLTEPEIITEELSYNRGEDANE